jgi:fatty acid desaturase
MVERQHNQHHATPNHVDKDGHPVPMIAFAESQGSRRRIFLPIQVQAFIFAFLFPLQARTCA